MYRVDGVPSLDLEHRGPESLSTLVDKLVDFSGWGEVLGRIGRGSASLCLVNGQPFLSSLAVVFGTLSDRPPLASGMQPLASCGSC